jgi:hypothetical protein
MGSQGDSGVVVKKLKFVKMCPVCCCVHYVVIRWNLHAVYFTTGARDLEYIFFASRISYS